MPDFGGSVARMQEFSALLEVGLSRVFKDDLPTHPKLYDAWLVEKKASEWIEDELITTGFGTMPEKGVGGPFLVDKPYISDPKTYTMVPHGLGFVAEYELIRWDKYSVFKGITKKLTRSGVQRKNVLAYAILNNSFSSSDSRYTTYRSEALVSTSHALLRGGTAKNAPTVNVALSYLGIQEAITDYMTMVNEDGHYIILEPEVLVCHPSQKWVADTLLKSEYRPDNANRAHNTIKSAFRVHCAPFLTNTNYWWLLADKEKLEISFHVGDDLMFRRDFEFSTWNNVFSMYGSFRVAVLHWYGIWGSQGS